MTEKLSKKGYIVNEENNTIYCPEYGEIPIEVIKIAHATYKTYVANKKVTDPSSPWFVPKEAVPQEFKDIYKRVLAKEISITAASKELGISRATFYRYRDKYKIELENK